MSISFNTLIEKINQLERECITIKTEPKAFKSFPFPHARIGQNEAIKRMLEEDYTVLTFPTGYGKTVCFLTAIAEWLKKDEFNKAIIITRTNSLQEQILEYSKYYSFELVPLFAREKECKRLEGNVPACYTRIDLGAYSFFWYEGKRLKYPCFDCPYESKLKQIEIGFTGTKSVVPIFNGGHLFLVKKFLKISSGDVFVIVDEADSTLEMLMSVIKVPSKAVPLEKDVDIIYENTIEYLYNMLSRIREDIREIINIIKGLSKVPIHYLVELRNLRLEREKIESDLNRLRLFKHCGGKLIAYEKEGYTCLEVVGYNILTIAKNLFEGGCKICLVSATPQNQKIDAKIIDITNCIKYKNRIFVCPLANMSYTKVSDTDFKTVAWWIVNIIKIGISKNWNNKYVLHAGNNNYHAKKFYEYISEACKRANLKLNLLIKEEDVSQIQVIRQFKNAKEPTLLVGAGFEYGEDFRDVTAQFIGKIPYPNLKDPKVEKLKELLGEDKFRKWYVLEAVRKLVQACGRNARSPETFSFTVIFDESIRWLLNRHKYLFPKWFLQKVEIIR